LPFLFGAAQLIEHKHISPKSICSKETVDAFYSQYMYLGCIHFINEVKTGSFFEHSPLLYDISGARNWQKVNDGMVKMFKAEVLGKLPIMKHFHFGPFIPFDLQHNRTVCADRTSDHTHNHFPHHYERPASPRGDRPTSPRGEKPNTATVASNGPLYCFNSCCVQKLPSAIGAREFSKMPTSDQQE